MLYVRCWFLLGCFFVRMHGLSCGLLFVDCRVFLLIQLPCWLFELSFVRMLKLPGWELLRYIGPLSSDGTMRRGYVLGRCFKSVLELSRWYLLAGVISARVLELSGWELLRHIGPHTSNGNMCCG